MVNLKTTPNNRDEWFGLLFASTILIRSWLWPSPVLEGNGFHRDLAVELDVCLASALKAITEVSEVIHAFNLSLCSVLFRMFLLMTWTWSIETTSSSLAWQIYQRFLISSVCWFHVGRKRLLNFGLSLDVVNVLTFFDLFTNWKRWWRIKRNWHWQELEDSFYIPLFWIAELKMKFPSRLVLFRMINRSNHFFAISFLLLLLWQHIYWFAIPYRALNNLLVLYLQNTI